MTAVDPADLDAVELLAAFRAHELSPVEATAAVPVRIAKLDPRVNAKPRRRGTRRVRRDPGHRVTTGAVLGACETPIDKMLSFRPRRVTVEFVPDRGAEPRPDGL